ncbi:hypothetical protein C8Q80DRAFT_1135326 [Daedaleopsis nitida]|nr:hypothetical protein C8Q80DRAFT_1135326 [Daedaleopsis nitida]
MPILFDTCCILVRSHLTHKTFIPSALWPYIRELWFFVPNPIRTWSNERVVPLENNRFRIKFPLADTLSRMLNLHSVMFNGVCHSFSSWGVRRAVLSVPQLRRVEFHGPLWDDCVEKLPRKLPLKAAPITSFRVSCPDYRMRPRVMREDVSVVFALLSQLHNSLEALSLPSEHISLSTFRKYDWPRLHELKLRGECQSSPPIPVFPALSHIRTLRVLTLELAQSPECGLERQSMGSFDPTDGFPWRDLESLSVSYPHPEDKWYGLLPSTLRRLDLRCWPRHYMHLLWHDRRTVTDNLQWHSPILGSSEMLTILRRCRSSDAWRSVRQLDLEFREDQMDHKLFEYIPHAFPNVTFLQVHRYRIPDNMHVPVAEIADALSRFTQLQVLRLHLDFTDAPHPFAMYDATRSQVENDDPFDTIARTITDAADAFARAITTLRIACFLIRQNTHNRWIPFTIERGEGVVRAEIDHTITAIQVFPMNDEDGPYWNPRRVVIDRYEVGM